MTTTPMQVTITLAPDIAETVKTGIDAGIFASPADAVTRVLRDWQSQQTITPEQIDLLRSEIKKGMDDIVAGRVSDLDADDIIRRGNERLQKREKSRSQQKPAAT